MNATIETKQMINFQFTKDSFIKELKKALFFVPKKSTMPIIRNVKIESKNGEIRIYSTDSLNCYISDCLENIAATSDGQVLIDGQSLFKILDKSDKGDYSLTETEGSIVIEGQDCRFELKAVNSDEFPIFGIEDLNADYQFSIEGEQMAQALKKTAFCTRDEPSRFQMSGIAFQSNKENNSLDIVATDTTRLSKVQLNDVNLNDNSDDFQIIIRPFIAKFLIKFLNHNLKVNVFIDVNHIYFTCQGQTIISKLVSGIFPNYKKAIPEGEYTIEVERELLIKSLNKVLPFTSEITKSIGFQINEKSIVLTSEMPELGKASFNCKTITDNHEQPKMNVNPKYLLDGLKAVNTKTIDVIIKNEKRPLIIKPVEDHKTQDFLYLVMPVLSRQ